MNKLKTLRLLVTELVLLGMRDLMTNSEGGKQVTHMMNSKKCSIMAHAQVSKCKQKVPISM